MELTVDQALQQGVDAHKAGKLQEAEKLYNAILKSQPDHPDANHNLGVLGVGVGKVELALPYFKKALESNSKVEQYWVSYIDALIKLEQLDNAKAAFNQARATGLIGDKFDQLEAQLGDTPVVGSPVPEKTQPDRQQVEALLSLYGQGKMEEALAQGNTLMEEFPDDPNILNILGVVNFALKNYEKSIRHYNKVIKLKPNFADAHNNLGNALKELKQYEEAVRCYERAIELKSDYAEAYNNLGILHSDCHHYEKATHSFNKAIQLKPEDITLYYSLGNHQYKSANYEESIHSYRKVLVLRPGDALTYYNIGNALNELGHYGQAVLSYQKAIRLKPDYVEAYNNQGNSQKDLGYYQEAIRSFNQAIVLNPYHSDVHNNLGNILKENRKYKEAIIHFDLVDSLNAQSQSLECLYCDTNYTELFDRLNALSLSGSKNIRVAAVSAFVSHQLKKEDPYPFCKNPIDFFHTGNLKKYIENMDGFVRAVIAEAEQINSVWEPRNRTAVLGFATRPTILEAGEKCAFLKDIIEQEIKSYYSKFSSEDCSFISSWPEKYFLKGWYVRLVKNGHQESHIHPDGWVSGVVYLKTVNPRSNNEGAIEVGLHGYELPILNENYPRKAFQPQTGDIVLFPSSLFHKTIPFEENTDRCVIAFDLYPIKS